MPAPSAPGRPSQYLQLCAQLGKEGHQKSSSIPSSHEDALRQLQFLLNELGEQPTEIFRQGRGWGGAGILNYFHSLTN